MFSYLLLYADIYMITCTFMIMSIKTTCLHSISHVHHDFFFFFYCFFCKLILPGNSGVTEYKKISSLSFLKYRLWSIFACLANMFINAMGTNSTQEAKIWPFSWHVLMMQHLRNMTSLWCQHCLTKLPNCQTNLLHWQVIQSLSSLDGNTGPFFIGFLLSK